MKKTGWLFLLVLTFQLSIAQNKKFFEKGKVYSSEDQRRSTGINTYIPLSMSNNLPLVQVTIAGKAYTFLFDSGAPTVISTAIYERLGLKPSYEGKVTDSQDTKNKQIFTVVPEMQLGELVFTETAAVVLDLHHSVFGCFNIDGILGANQMAKLVWQVNYAENSLHAVDHINALNMEGYDIILPFSTSMQKTPYVKLTLWNKTLSLTFDTGYSGNIKVQSKYFQSDKTTDYIALHGASSVGAYGTAKDADNYLFLIDQLQLADVTFSKERASTGTSNLLGNGFLQDYAYILDWKNSKIYLKRLQPSKPEIKTFGFDYLFINNVPTVVATFNAMKDIQNGDIILYINDIDMQNLSAEQACHYLLNKVEKDLHTITVKIKRKDEILTLTLAKKTYLQQ